MTRPNIHVGRADIAPSDTRPYRYGIFLEPPAEIALPALRAMDVAERLFGFHAANAYAPHITLVGSIVLDGTEGELRDTISAELAKHASFPVHNGGLTASLGSLVGFDFHHRADGSANDRLVELYTGLAAATAGLRGYEPSDRHADRRRATEAPEKFRGHLTLIGHDAAERPEAARRARAVLESLVADTPVSWTADTVTLYRFWSADWTDRYWLTQEWVPLQSWRLG